MIVERSKLTSRQKRSIFEKRFGEILLPAGFFSDHGTFFRLHPGECLLFVRMDLARTNCYIEFDALPFCGAPQNDSMPQRVDLFQHLLPCSFEDYYLKSFENGRFDRQFELFCEHILKPFLQITDAKSLLDFHDKVLSPLNISLPQRELMLNLRLENYVRARGCIERIRSHTLGCMQSDRDDFAFNQKWSGDSENDSEFLEQRTAAHKQTLELCDSWTAHIDGYDFAPLQKIVSNNIAASDEICRGKWPRFYENN